MGWGSFSAPFRAAVRQVAKPLQVAVKQVAAPVEVAAKQVIAVQAVAVKQAVAVQTVAASQATNVTNKAVSQTLAATAPVLAPIKTAVNQGLNAALVASKQGLQVATLGHANQVIDLGLKVTHNPYFQAIVISAAIMASGGAAAAALGFTGTFAVSIATAVAGTVYTRVNGKTFSLVEFSLAAIPGGEANMYAKQVAQTLYALHQLKAARDKMAKDTAEYNAIMAQIAALEAQAAAEEKHLMVLADNPANFKPNAISTAPIEDGIIRRILVNLKIIT